MPGNSVVINHSKKHEWYVGDSKMDLLIMLLNEIGFREGSRKAKAAEEVDSKACCGLCVDRKKGWSEFPCILCGGRRTFYSYFLLDEEEYTKDGKRIR